MFSRAFHWLLFFSSSADWFLAALVDGEPWGMDDEVISRLVEDAIDSESREVSTMSRSRSVSQAAFL